MNTLTVCPERVELKQLVQRIAALAGDRRRIIVAIAGAPASGKSTLAAWLVKQIDARLGAECSVVLPMDGYHYDNAVIEPMGLLSRKGSPDTFDAAGFTHLLNRLQEKRDTDLEQSVAIPVFDREQDLARAGAVLVTPDKSVIVAEGNYLLLPRPEWTAMLRCFDLTVSLDVPSEILEHRLVERWLELGHSQSQALERAMQNDIPNAETVTEESVSSDLSLVFPFELY